MAGSARGALAAALLLAVAGCGGETVVSGIGNSGNVIGTPDVLERVADAVAELEAVTPVGDDELLAAWSAIRERARGGDPDAALVLLRVAERQREDAEKQ